MLMKLLKMLDMSSFTLHLLFCFVLTFGLGQILLGCVCRHVDHLRNDHLCYNAGLTQTRLAWFLPANSHGRLMTPTGHHDKTGHDSSKKKKKRPGEMAQ